MKDLQKLRYLAAMGVETFVSRRDLPGAAPSQRLRIVAPASPSGSSSSSSLSPAPPLSAVKAQLATNPQTEIEPVVADLAESAPDSSAGELDMAVFSVIVTWVGGRYWLDEIPPGRVVPDDYPHLLLAICRALNWPASAPLVEQFNWPPDRIRQIDRGEEVARHRFRGYMLGRLEQHNPQGVVLLGELDTSWFDPALFGGLPCVQTLSAWRMLRDPSLKAQAWQDLKPLRIAEP